MNKAILLLSLFAFFGCKQGVKKSTSEENHSISHPGDTAIRNTRAPLEPGCYRMVIVRDTAEMKIKVMGDSVSGDLQYNPFEKDGSFGKFSGILKDSIIYGGYTFESEGKVSYREVVYKMEGNGLVEGFGDIDMKNDSAWFKYPQTLKFEHNHPFIKVDCK